MVTTMVPTVPTSLWPGIVRAKSNLLKWYIGQWVDKLMALAEDL